MIVELAWPTPLDREHFTDDFCGRNAITVLQRTPSDRPWCLWVNFPGPHGPQDAPEALFERYAGVNFPYVFRGEEESLFDLEADEQETASCLDQNPNVARQLRVAMRDVFGRLRFRGVFKQLRALR